MPISKNVTNWLLQPNSSFLYLNGTDTVSNRSTKLYFRLFFGLSHGIRYFWSVNSHVIWLTVSFIRLAGLSIFDSQNTISENDQEVFVVCPFIEFDSLFYLLLPYASSHHITSALRFVCVRVGKGASVW